MSSNVILRGRTSSVHAENKLGRRAVTLEPNRRSPRLCRLRGTSRPANALWLVIDDFEETDQYARFDFEPTMLISVFRTGGARHESEGFAVPGVLSKRRSADSLGREDSDHARGAVDRTA